MTMTLPINVLQHIPPVEKEKKKGKKEKAPGIHHRGPAPQWSERETKPFIMTISGR
jgi:hypothetical protein